MAEKTKDTLFIDMKYVILYRKLGYDEIAPDIFVYRYSDTELTIFSEEQRFEYLGKSYPLLAYKDFAILECVDRLLKKGYASRDVVLGDPEYDVVIKKPGGAFYLGILAEGWGKSYETMLRSYERRSQKNECLYTSQLSGGLVEFKSELHIGAEVYTEGVFERNAPLYPQNFYNPAADGEFPPEFTVRHGELLKYMGSSKTVVVPQGIVRIGTGAFWANFAIEEVVLPEGLECICGDAFVYCENLKQVNIPSSVTEMGDDPFAGCLNIEIENRSAHFINENGVLFDSTKRFLIHYTAGKEETEYIIPESVTWIGKHSFYKCQNLRLVTITRNVRFMGNNAFSDCRNIQLKNESVYFQYVDGVLYDRNATTCMHYSMGSGVKVVKLLDTVRTIGRNCFWNCDMIEKIIIPKSVRQIGYNPFANCKNVVIENHSPYYCVVDGILYDATVKEVVYCPPSAAKEKRVLLPETVENIGRSAFTGCFTLTDIALSDKLRFISRSAFSGCTALRKICIPSSVEDIADWCFSGCTVLEKIYLPRHIQLKQNALKGCSAEVIRI